MEGTITLDRPSEAVALPDLDVNVGNQIGDEILLGTALADAKAVGKVRGGPRTRFQSHQARAWTSSGDVD